MIHEFKPKEKQDMSEQGIHSLRYHRRWQLISQRDLALKSGVSASTVHLIESGQTMPTIGTIRQLCKTLNVPAQSVEEFRVSLAREPRYRGRS